MAKAVLDLPDTLDSADSPERGANVDDLLAQMAGDEIDRLLSEADDPREAGQRKAAPVAQVMPPQAIASAPIDAPPTGVDTAVAPAAAAVKVPQAVPERAAASSADVDPFSDQLDALFSELEATGPANPVPTAAPPLPAPAAVINVPLPTHVAEVREPGPAVPGEETETSPAERSALDVPVAEPEDHADGFAFAADEDERLPFYLKPLSWLNAPLDSCSDGTRDLIGKLALLTLFNAAVVLGYVLIFRKHH